MMMGEKILIAGGSGLVGERLVYHLQNAGYQPLVLTRQESLCRSSDLYVHWDIGSGQIDTAALDVPHVVNLCGAGIADQRWTPDRRRTLIDSRIQPTQLLVDRLDGLQTYISASAVGYYGDRGEYLCTEETDPQDDSFLSEVCQRWEEAAMSAQTLADRLHIFRIGVVLARDGGALQKIAQTMPFGLASYIGSGDQYMSWIHIDDLCRMIVHALQSSLPDILYNAVAPHPVTNKEFTKVTRDVVSPRSLLLPAPSLAIKAMFGDMSAVVLDSTRVSSARMESTGFEYQYPELREALEQIYR